MVAYHILCLSFLLSSWSIILCRQSASAFLASPTGSTAAKSNSSSGPSSILLHAGFEQLPGESTTDFIKRVTSQSKDLLDKQQNGQSITTDSENSDEAPKPRGKYQRIEDWDAEQKAKGQNSWEERVQFDGQRFGNQVKQNDILRRHLGGF